MFDKTINENFFFKNNSARRNKSAVRRKKRVDYQLLERRDLLTGAVGVVELVSFNAAGTAGANDGAWDPSVSADGRYIAFHSGATDIVPGDQIFGVDVFVRDTLLDTTVKVRSNFNGGEANQGSIGASISADGRFVAFNGYASDLIPNDTNGDKDIFLADMVLGTMTRVNTDSTGAESVGGDSSEPSISDDGRFVTFTSHATNLVADDTNGLSDVFVKDMQTGEIARISTSSAGEQADHSSSSSVISGNGQFVAFESHAGNLTSTPDTNTATDLFVKDLQTGETTLVSIDTNGESADSFSVSPSFDYSGRYLAFYSGASDLVAGDTNEDNDVFVADLELGTTIRVSVDSFGLQANDNSRHPAISDDGRSIAFESSATNLVGGADDNSAPDLFLKNLDTGKTIRVSNTPTGESGNNRSDYAAISGDGTVVAFSGVATDLVSQPVDSTNTFQFTVTTKPEFFVNAGDSDRETVDASSSGLLIEETLTVQDVDVTDVVTGSVVSLEFIGDDDTLGSAALLSMLTVGPDPVLDDSTDAAKLTWTFDSGSETFAHLVNGESLELNYVVAATDSNGISDTHTISVTIFGTFDFSNQISIVSVDSNEDVSNGDSYAPAISPDGRFVAFTSRSTNLVSETVNEFWDIYLRDTVLGTTQLVSTNINGDGGNISSIRSTISADGRYVAFDSSSTDLVPDDTDSNTDVFVKDMWLGTMTRVSLGVDGAADGDSYFPTISDDGKSLAFTSDATNLVDGDNNGRRDVFFVDLVSGTISLVSESLTGVDTFGASHYQSISGDGRFVVFESSSSDLVADGVDDNNTFDVFVKDMLTGSVSRLSSSIDGNAGDGSSVNSEISYDGRFITFQSVASDIVSDDDNGTTDVFVVDRLLGTTTRVGSDIGDPATSFSAFPSISDDGRYVSFISMADDWVHSDNAGISDVFVKDLWLGTTKRYSTDPTGGDADGESGNAKLSGDGRYLVFATFAENMIGSASNGVVDVFQTVVAEETLIKNHGVGYFNSAFGSGTIVPDKSVLLPGETASFENYSSYVHGINSLSIDIDAAGATNISADDFEFRFGNSDDVSTWSQITPNVMVNVDVAAGVNASDRISLVFDDGVITNGWLQVKFLANDNTGLVADDVFYFGNAIGETGNASTDARVNLVDVGLTRANQTGFTSAAIDNVHDFNRDGRVNLVDVAIARANQSGFGALQLITPNASSTIARDGRGDSKVIGSGLAAVANYTGKAKFSTHRMNQEHAIKLPFGDNIEERKLAANSASFLVVDVEPIELVRKDRHANDRGNFEFAVSFDTVFEQVEFDVDMI